MRSRIRRTLARSLAVTGALAVWAGAPRQVQIANATPIATLISSELSDARLGARAHLELAAPVQVVGD